MKNYKQGNYLPFDDLTNWPEWVEYCKQLDQNLELELTKIKNKKSVPLPLPG